MDQGDFSNAVILTALVFAAFDDFLYWYTTKLEHHHNCGTIGCFVSDQFRYYWGISNMVLGFIAVMLSITIFYKLRIVSKQKGPEHAQQGPNKYAAANRTSTGVLISSLLFLTIPSVCVGIVELTGFSIFKLVGPFYSACFVDKLRYFSGFYWVIWIVYCTIFGLQYALGACLFLGLDPVSTEYFREEMMKRYETNISTLPAMSLVAYNPTDGSTRWWNLGGIANICYIVNVQYGIMIYCGWSMHTRMEEKIRNFSEILKKHHKQFFKTLVLQITAPTLILFIPISFINFVPVFNLNISLPSGALLCCFTLYPAMDSLIVMSVVSEYRKTAEKVYLAFRNFANEISGLKRTSSVGATSTIGLRSMAHDVVSTAIATAAKGFSNYYSWNSVGKALFSPSLYRRMDQGDYSISVILLSIFFAIFDDFLYWYSTKLEHHPDCGGVGCFVGEQFLNYWGLSNMVFGLMTVFLSALIFLKLRVVTKQKGSLNSQQGQNKYTKAHRTSTGILMSSLLFLTLPSVCVGIVELTGFSVFKLIGAFYLACLLISGENNFQKLLKV
ncbi:hypothetical protein L5515_006662 [Caenorhabditis briggsae]|uniref:Uncharacterized protein n=1 Tax=Caenorhabditis briggsae TaxID=6238 RepID=A0AAE9EWH7_CAEBR|nr:hypothetical protein L5515_006662 [Caenorhabditis briggsae]